MAHSNCDKRIKLFRRFELQDQQISHWRSPLTFGEFPVSLTALSNSPTFILGTPVNHVVKSAISNAVVTVSGSAVRYLLLLLFSVPQ